MWKEWNERKFYFEVFLRAGFWAGFQSLHLKKKISWLDIIFCGFFIDNKICFLLWLKFIEFRENKLVSTALKSRIQKQNLSDVLCVRYIGRTHFLLFVMQCRLLLPIPVSIYMLKPAERKVEEVKFIGRIDRN